MKTKQPLHKGKRQILLLLCLCFSNISYLAYLIILGYFNRLAADDYCFMKALNDNGYWGAISFWYSHWQGRFGPHLIIDLIIILYNYFNSLFIYLLVLIGLYIYSVSKILQYLLLEMEVSNNKFLLFNFGTLIFNMHVLSNFEFSTLYWLNASAMYFGGIAFALLGLSEIVSHSKKIHSYFLIVIGFAYSGSSAENFSVICLFLLFLLFIYRLLNYQIKLSKKTLLDKEVIAFFTCLLAFLIMFFAPGNKIRRTFLPAPSFTNTILISIKSLEFLLFDLMYKKSLILFILSFPFIYLGVLCRNKYSTKGLKLFKWLVLGSMLFISFLWITLLPNSYAVSWGLEPRRSLTHISFYIVCFLGFFYFLIGYKALFNRHVSLMLSILSCFAIVLYSSKGYILNFTETIKYVRSQDEMIKRLSELNNFGNKDILYLDKLYESEDVVFIVNDISFDHINKCISDGLNLGYAIELKETHSIVTDDH
jgi:hypothetical protein